MMQSGRASLNAPWIMPTSRLLTVTGAAGVTRSPAHLHDDRARILSHPPRDAARVAGGAALLAGDLPEGRIRADAVDHETVVVGHRCHLGRVELDHRIVEAVVARDHRAQSARGLSAPSAATCAPGPPQCAEVKPISSPLPIGPMVVRVHMRVAVDDDARAAAHRDVARRPPRACRAAPSGPTQSRATVATTMQRSACMQSDTPVRRHLSSPVSQVAGRLSPTRSARRGASSRHF